MSHFIAVKAMQKTAESLGVEGLAAVATIRPKHLFALGTILYYQPIYSGSPSSEYEAKIDEYYISIGSALAALYDVFRTSVTITEDGFVNAEQLKRKGVVVYSLGADPSLEVLVVCFSGGNPNQNLAIAYAGVQAAIQDIGDQLKEALRGITELGEMFSSGFWKDR